MMNNRIDKLKILFIEDDPNLGYLLHESLDVQGYEVVRCEDREAGYSVFLKEKFDLCLIDVMLPKKDSFTVAREILEIDQEIPIIFLTVSSSKADRIEIINIRGKGFKMIVK